MKHENYEGFISIWPRDRKVFRVAKDGPGGPECQSTATPEGYWEKAEMWTFEYECVRTITDSLASSALSHLLWLP